MSSITRQNVYSFYNKVYDYVIECLELYTSVARLIRHGKFKCFIWRC